MRADRRQRRMSGRMSRNCWRTTATAGTESTNRVAQQVGIDEFYESFDALSPDNISYLGDFISDLLSSRNQRDWLWLPSYVHGRTTFSKRERRN
jgi:hypothetical protein